MNAKEYRDVLMVGDQVSVREAWEQATSPTKMLHILASTFLTDDKWPRELDVALEAVNAEYWRARRALASVPEEVRDTARDVVEHTKRETKCALLRRFFPAVSIEQALDDW